MERSLKKEYSCFPWKSQNDRNILYRFHVDRISFRKIQLILRANMIQVLNAAVWHQALPHTTLDLNPSKIRSTAALGPTGQSSPLGSRGHVLTFLAVQSGILLTKTFFGSRHEKQIAGSTVFDTKNENAKVLTTTPRAQGWNSRDCAILHGPDDEEHRGRAGGMRLCEHIRR